MKQETVDSQELISALADGDLRGKDFARAMARIEASAQARAFWHASHLAGDVLRAPELARSAAGDADFVLRLRQRLAHEPSVIIRSPGAADVAAVPAGVPAANDARLRWQMVAGLTSLAVFLGAGWHLITDRGGAQTSQQLAAQAITPQTGQITMLRDPRLDQLLAAHQQLGGASALQKPAGFLRSATYEPSAR